MTLDGTNVQVFVKPSINITIICLFWLESLKLNFVKLYKHF